MTHHIERTIEPLFNILLSPRDCVVSAFLGLFHEHLHGAERGEGGLKTIPLPYSANLCRAQKLLGRCFRRQPQLMLVFAPLHP